MFIVFFLLCHWSILYGIHPSLDAEKNPPTCLNVFLGSSTGILLFIEGQISGSDSEVAPCMGEVV
jgi:hypothetical protein